MPSVRLIACLAIVGAMVAACKSTTTPPTPTPTTLTLSVSAISLSALGDIATITATVRDQNGNAMTGQTVTWGIADAGVATVGTAGTTVQVTAVANGETVVTATSGSLTAQVEVTVAQAATQLVKVSGDAQTGQVGSALLGAIEIEARDVRGNPVKSGGTATFTITSGGGSVAPASATLGANGRASTAWTLGTVAGTSHQLTAAVGTATAVFDATALPGPASALVKVSGDNQTGTVSAALAESVVVRVNDQFGNAFPSGYTVTFAVTGGGGSVSPGSLNTDANGRVATRWTLGSALGAQAMTATAAGLTGSPVTFTATGQAAAVTSIAKLDGDNQIGLVGKAVNLPPAVRVLDQNNNGVSGVNVTFAVTGGGGGMTGENATTDANGVARIGSWTLGGSVGANALQASSGALTPVAFAATGQTAQFDIVVRFFGSRTPTASQAAAFTAAEAKWESLIFGELDNVQLTNMNLQQCTNPADTALPASLTEAIDDLVIYAKVDTIDGPGTVLGSAGPCLVRSSGSQPGLPLLGVMKFDKDDLANLEAAGQLNLVVLHEMGHVLGYGAVWNCCPSQTFFSLLSGAGSNDPFFTGTNGRAAFDRVGGTAYIAGQKVPVENTGGLGTQDAHWRESVFDRELMTGFLDAGANPQPISIVTLGSLWDMNYRVAYANADTYAWPSPPALRAGAGAEIEMKDDILRGPIFGVDASGRVVRVIRR